ncbi:hypothetical protein Shyhy01_54730 [Streptomyces hygroscopicus subsp. hygroscopicus]|nr:hypothetical protein [Streptomyces hygroscopicus]GLX52523.1 hypothetical protein Shyhy01_54730 [Streptomyces hygroscopicus subsp. hygroscopicus]
MIPRAVGRAGVRALRAGQAVGQSECHGVAEHFADEVRDALPPERVPRIRSTEKEFTPAKQTVPARPRAEK